MTEKVENKAEFAKYQLYVTELGKVMKLLLQLSGRLARANNAINTLAEGGENKEKVRAFLSALFGLKGICALFGLRKIFFKCV